MPVLPSNCFIVDYELGKERLLGSVFQKVVGLISVFKYTHPESTSFHLTLGIQRRYATILMYGSGTFFSTEYWSQERFIPWVVM